MNNPINFIEIEGTDGAGKSEQAERLRIHFEKKGRKVLVTHEPTYKTEASRRIRRILRGGEVAPALRDMQLLYIEDRRTHVAEVILPALEHGDMVIADRYWLSTVAYVGIELGKSGMEEFIELHKDILKPDIAIALLTTPTIALDRITEKRGEEPELFDKVSSMNAINQNYRALTEYENTNLVLVDGDPPIENVFQACLYELGEAYTISN